jgi:hypothetical protein
LEAHPTWNIKYINDPKIARDAANSTFTSAEDLSLLASSQHIFVREAVASNPNTPASVVEALFPSKLETEHEIRLALAIVNNLVYGAKFSLPAICIIISNIKLFERCDYYQLVLIRAIASHPEVKIDEISLLIDPNYIPRYIRHRIAEVAIKKELLVKLSQDPAARVRARPTQRLAMLKEEELSSSTHDPDLVYNPQTRLSHYPNIQPKPSQLPPQLENLSQSIY